MDHRSFDSGIASHRQHPSYDGLPWRCRVCGVLLGIARGGELHVKYKGAEVWIIGTCRRTCCKCGERNEVTVGARGEKEGA